MSTEYVLGVKHLVLPAKEGKEADNLAKTIRNICRDWMGGGTSCGNTVWGDFMMPKLQEAEGMIKKKKWKEALGVLLGLQLFASYDDDWIRDQQEHAPQVGGGN